MKFLIGILWIFSVAGSAFYAHEFAYEKAFREARQEFEKNRGYRFNQAQRAFAGE